MNWALLFQPGLLTPRTRKPQCDLEAGSHSPERFSVLLSPGKSRQSADSHMLASDLKRHREPSRICTLSRSFVVTVSKEMAANYTMWEISFRDVQTRNV